MTDSSQISRGTHRILVGSRSVASQSGAPLVLILGVIGQWVDSRTPAIPIVSSEIHALFGLSLCAVVFTHFHKSMTASSQDIEKFSRSLSRKIYLLMYILLGLRIAIGLDHTLAQPAEGFRDYLIGGVLALVLVRVLSARGRSLKPPHSTPV